MRKLSVLTLLLLGTQSFSFTQGNLVVATIGDPGSDSLNQPVSLHEYTTAGISVGTPLSLNNVLARNITTTWAETSEGMLELSDNGQYLMVCGYDLAPLSASFSIYDTPRTVARINASGAIQFASAFSLYDEVLLLGDGARGVASKTGEDFVVTGGDAGLTVGTFSGGVPTQVFNPGLSTRTAHWRNNTLYFLGSNAYFAPAATSGINGLTTWSGVIGDSFAKPGLFPTPMTSSSNPGSGRDFEFLNDDVMYVAASSGSVGIVKMLRTNGVWSEAYRIAGIGFTSIALDSSGTTPVLYATGSAGADLFKITDTGTAFTTPTSIAVAPTSTRFRGVSWAPSSGSGSISGTVNLGSYAGLSSGSGNVTLTYEILSPGGSLLSSGTTSVTPSGGVASYSISAGSATGAVTVRLSGSTWLRRSVSTTVGATNANLILPNGNVHSDANPGFEVIDIADYTDLATAFDGVEGGSTYNPAADLNKDTIIDIADYTILATNFDSVDN